MKALANRPDLRAALQGITREKNWLNSEADGKQDVTVSGNYSHVSISAPFRSEHPTSIFDHRQGQYEQARRHL